MRTGVTSSSGDRRLKLNVASSDVITLSLGGRQRKRSWCLVECLSMHATTASKLATLGLAAFRDERIMLKVTYEISHALVKLNKHLIHAATNLAQHEIALLCCNLR
jgi:hypothetical protein